MIGIARVNPRMTIRFRGAVPAEVAALVDQAAGRINGLTRASWRLGLPTSSSARRDEVVITMQSETACDLPANGDAIVFACTTRSANTAMVTADIEINPLIVGTAMLRTTVLHEMAHAAGLDDYNALYAGRWQVMRTTCVVGLRDYELGDRSGLLSLAV
jgi:hypothetical protein